MNRSLVTLVQVSAAIAVSLGGYIVSATVGQERDRIASLHRNIDRDEAEIRSLAGAIDARAGLPSVQAWNDHLLALSAPAPAQILDSPARLVAYMPSADAPAIVQAVAQDTAPAPEATRPTLIASQIAPSPSLGSPSHFPPPVRGSVGLTPPSPEPGEGQMRSTREREVAVRAAATQVTSTLIAARVPAPPSADLADLTQSIGRELKAVDSPVRRVALR